MVTNAKFIGLLLLCTGIYAVGVLLFTKGFLLSRVVVENNSTCQVDFAVQSEDNGEEGCWTHKRFKRAVLVIVDALKFDFMEYNSSLKDPPFYKNKLPYIHSLLTRHPERSLLFRFMADPPTTTLQRLKGLTTGSLPTFVDASANFASSEITEDNIIDQLLKQNKKIKFLGDDTWMGLFPGRFHKSFPFPSFNVKDLHTVDNGILSHLYSEVRQRNWDVVIAHFLGVDHCGHRYGPNHPAMAEKLQQMDNMLRNLTMLLKEDTVLFVLGDHGMTATGDHGGDSPAELEAGLFVYSPVQITSHGQGGVETLSQTDLVPTLALLLGVPVPFSNLGMVVSPLFSHCPWWGTNTSPIKQTFHVVKALHLNALQISRYLATYAGKSADIPSKPLAQAERLLAHAESDLREMLTAMVAQGNTQEMLPRLRKLKEHYVEYITTVRELCRGVWAKFDLASMALGALTFIVGLSLNVYLYLVVAKDDKTDSLPAAMPFVIFLVVLQTAYACVQSMLLSNVVNPLMAFILSGFTVTTLSVLIKKACTSTNDQSGEKEPPDSCNPSNLCDWFANFVCVVFICLYFSNSFVVYEDSVAAFFAQTLIWFSCARLLGLSSTVSYKRQKDARMGHSQSKSKSSLLHRMKSSTALAIGTVTLLCSGCLRLSTLFFNCREEKVDCEALSLLQPLGSFAEDVTGYRNARYFLCLVCLVAFVAAVLYWLSHYGNLNGSSVSVLFVRFALPLATLACALHWAVQCQGQKTLEEMTGWQQTLMARVVLVSLGAVLLALVAKPLLVFAMTQSSGKPIIPLSNISNSSQIIPQVYQQLRQNWSALKSRQSEDEEGRPPVVFGMGTVYSSCLVAITLVLSVLTFLLLGDGLAPPLLLTLVAVVLFLEMYAAERFSEDEGEGHLRPVPWIAVVTLGIFTSVAFYATGHQPTIPSIRWEAAFIGFHGDHSTNIIPAFLVICHTFAAQILFGVISPLLLFWPTLEGAVSSALRPGGRENRRWQGDFVFFDNGPRLRALLLKLLLGVMLFAALKVMGAMGAAALHRRHLMVWKIFAPRFVFEGAAMLVTFAVVLTVGAFLLRVDAALARFTFALQTDFD